VFLFLWDKLATHQHDQNQLQQQLILPPEELFEHEPNGFYYLFAVHWMTVHRPLGAPLFISVLSLPITNGLFIVIIC
jgi:hypothetical protein